MVAKTNVPASAEVGLVAATTGAACGDGKEEWDLDSGASIHMSHTQTGMTVCKNQPAGTTVEVADGTILPVDGLETVDVDLGQSGTTTKLVKMVSVEYVPVFSRNLLSTRKPLVYYETKAVLGFPGEESLLLNCPRKKLFSATGVRRTPSQGAALVLAAKMAEAIRVETTGQWGPCADVRRSSSQGAALALAAKTAEAMRAATGQLGPCAGVRRSPWQGAALAVAAKERCDEGTSRARGPQREVTGGAIGSRQGDTRGVIGP